MAVEVKKAHCQLIHEQIAVPDQLIVAVEDAECGEKSWHSAPLGSVHSNAAKTTLAI